MLLGDDDSLNPMLSVINLVDLFLVIIAALLIIIAQHPLNPFQEDEVIVIKNPGKPDMEMIIKEGEKMEKYQSSGEIGRGNGVKAGITYRMEDGSMVYVPETGTKTGKKKGREAMP